MSVNIFGASGITSSDRTDTSDVNKIYVDQKFETLSTNLVTKVNKTGDEISGDLLILVDEDKLRTFGVSGIGPEKSVSLLLGDDDNQLLHNFGHPIEIAASRGCKFTCPMGDICQLGEIYDTKARFFNDIIMNDNLITGLKDPSAVGDAATKKYVDDTILTLRDILQTKANKSEGAISGDLLLRIGEDHLRSFGVLGMGPGKGVSLLLGNVRNQLRCRFDTSIMIEANHGCTFMCPVGEICQLGSQNDTKSLFYNDVSMSNNGIGDLRNPTAKQDAATKHYVDSRFSKSNLGYVPNLTSNNNKNGFIVSASSESTETAAYNVFSYERSDWKTGGINTNFWIQLKCPDKIRVYKIKLCGLRISGGMSDQVSFNWEWHGSNNGTVWTTLNDYNSMIGSDILDFPVNSSAAYYYYRIFVNKAETTNPGFSYWQLYSLSQ